MVSARCKLVVKEALKKQDFILLWFGLGEVEIMEAISDKQREQLRVSLSESGLELMDDKRAIMIEKIKNTIIRNGSSCRRSHKVKFL